MDIHSIWNYKLQILPVLTALLLCEVPNFIRKYKKFYYIPIYFPLFPLRELNPNLAVYLGEDYFLEQGATITPEEARRIKKKIIFDSAVSMFISAIAIPAFVGFCLSFYVNEEVLWQSLIFVSIYKLINIVKAVWDFKIHAIASTRNITLLIIVYIFYLGVFFQLLKDSYYWGRPYILSEKYSELIGALSQLIFSKGVLQGILLAGLAAFFANLITDKNIRDANIKNQNGSNSEEDDY